MEIKKFQCGMIDFLPCSFKEYFLENNMPEKIKQLKKGLDQASLEVIESTIKKIIHLPDTRYKDVFYYDSDELSKKFGDSRNCYNELMTQERYQYFSEKYKFPFLAYDAEVLIYHHSLFERSNKFKNYLKNKIFIDGGAFMGDSVLVMLQYSPYKIFSFEISEENIKNYNITMQLNNVSPDKYMIIKKGLSDHTHKKKLLDLHHEGVSEFITSDAGDYPIDNVDFVSLDEFYFEEKEIGFIKADIEGSMVTALKGMEQIIKKYRPVCSFAIYHSPYEFFETKPLLEEFTKDLNYTIEVHNKVSFPDNIFGVTLFAYPTEIN